MGKITVRLPDDLHEQITEAAEDDDRSLNSEIVRLLRAALKNREES